MVVQYWVQQNDEQLLQESREKLKTRLNIVEAMLTAVLGSTSITVDDFLKLNSGDVIALENKSSNPIKLLVEDEMVYYAKPGVVGKNMGVQILDIIDKDVENYE